jgi:transmembrane sensor
MKVSRPNLSRYVVTGDTAARADRIWLGVSERLGRGQPNAGWRSSWVLASSVALAVGLVTGILVTLARAPSGWAKLETAGEGVTVQLQDGSRVTLERQTRLEVRESSDVKVALELERGHVDCDVVPNRRRAFAVSAGGFEVVVSGTRFGVDLSPERNRLEVDVRGGRVTVHRRDQTATEATLNAGDHWSIALRPGEGVSSPAAASGQGELPVVPETSARSLPVPSAADAGSTTAQGSSVVVSPTTGTSSPSAPSKAASTERASAKPRQSAAGLLLDQANVARRQGDLQGAARIFERLLSTYPNDPRAGLAAFELGRLRMDGLGDVRGAVAPFQTAIKLLGEPGLREDAMARLVRAFDLLGERELCLEARGVYLEAHPTGVHVGSVAEACHVNEK